MTRLKRLISVLLTLAIVIGIVPMSAITANAYSWDLKNGGTVTGGQTATITCYGGAAYQITNFEWDCTSNTIATIIGTDASGEVIYTRQINGSPYITKTFCYGGEQYVIDVIKGSIEISYNTANTVAPKITVTENYSDVPTASAYDYILVENSTSDDDYFYVTVAYNLVSHEQGAIMFGVESNNSGSFTILADLEHIVSAGVGRHTFTIPREEVNDEDVYVNISPYPHGDSWNPLDADEFKLKLTSSDDLLNQRENYYTITKPTFSILGSGENQLVGQDGYVVNYNGSQYTTNSTGRVLISDTNDPTEDVLITKEGYYDHKIPKEVIRNFNRVYMHKNTVQEPYLDNFYMRYDGSNAWENVLYNSIYFTEMSSQAFDIYVSANWCGQSAMKVYLQQGEVKLELTEGFNENVVLGSSFSATGGTIYLCLETVGKTYRFSPKIFVDNYNLELDMDLGSQDEAEISDDIQGVGGEELKISCSMLDFLPVGVSVSADGTVTGTIGIKAEDKHQATWYDEIKKSVSSHEETKIAETFKKLKKAEVPKWESKSSIGIGVDMSIIGYFTAHVVKESPNPDLVGTLQIDNIECAISIEGNVSASVQQFYGVVPVYWATELGLKLAFAFEMQKETPESNWEVQMPRMEIEISISGSGSLGVSKIVGAGLKASGAVTITIHAPDYNFDSSSCYVQVTTYVIGEILTFKGEKDFWESDKEYLWGEDYEESLEETSFSLFSDLSRYRVASVLNEETENKEVALQTEDGVNYTKNTFDSLSYSNSSIQTAKLSNGKTLFVWVDSVPSRLDINKAALYYTVFDPSTNEYSEVQMVKDDGTSDFTPQLTVGENGVYLVWANISDVADNDMSLLEFSAMMEIAFMEFDAEENTFINYMQLTDNSSLDLIPYAAESNGLPYVVWVNDVGGNLLATSNQVNLVAATFDGANWNTTVLQEELNSVTSMVAVSADEGVDVYYTMDNDLDYSTGADQELYRYAVDDVVQVTENEYPESDLRLVDGKPVWLSNGCVTSMEGLLTNRFTANVYGTATYDGGIVTLYSEPTGTENASESIYAVFTHNGITGVPIKVADTDSIVRSIDAYFDDGNLCFYTTENSIVDGVVNSSAIVEYSVELPNTLVITGTGYNDYSLKSNGELVANVSVRNLSPLPIEKYLVSVYDKKVSDVRTTRIYVPTASGDKKTLEISIPIPDAMEEEYLTFEIQPVFLNGETGETTDGIVTIYSYDVSLEDFSAYNENSGVSVTLSVVNRGIKPIDDVDIVVYKIGDENTEIYSTTISQIDVDDTKIIEFVSNDVLLNDILYATATSPYIENIVVNNEIHTAVINTPAQDSQMEETDNILNLDESKTLELSSGEYGLYAFIPKEDGWYAFFSEGDSDTYGYLYDGSMNQLQSDDQDGEGSNFKIIEELVGGETYFIKAKFYSSYRSGSFDLKAIKLVPAETIVIEQGDLIEGYPFESTSLSAYMTPVDIIPESYTWSSNDTTVVTVNSYGSVAYKAPGTATITVTSDSGLTDTIEVTVKEFPNILLNDTKNVVIDENQKVGYFKFTPEEDGWYAFYSVSEGDTYCYLYNATGSQLAYDNNNGDNSNFRVEYKMTAGETYVYKARYNYSSTTGSFDVKLEKMLAAESVAIVQGDSLSGYHGESFNLTYDFAPVNCIEEKITWTSSNQEVATVNSSGRVSLLTTGTVEITATSENGLTDVCTISVIDYPTITAGKQKTVEITELQKNGYFYFTPEADGIYIFYSISDSDTFGYLLNSEGTTLKSDDDSGDGSNFEIEYALTGGETYILKCKYYSSSQTGSFDVKIVEVVDAEAIQITNGETYSGQIGSSYQLAIQFLPDGARYEDVSWTSTDSGVVSVSSTGYINLIKEGSATITVTSATGLTDSITVEVTGYPAIVLNQEVVISTDEDSGTALFSFEPTVTGTYVFYSYDNDFDTYGHLYDSEMNQLASNDDGGEGNNFKISYKLIAGEKYYFRSRPYSSYSTGSYSVKITMLPAATSIEISQNEHLSAYVGDNRYLSVKFYPSDAESQSVVWTSSDESVAIVSSSGTVKCIKAGTAVITVTSEKGLTDTCTITVTNREPATNMYMNVGSYISGVVGFGQSIGVYFEPSNCQQETVTWTSDNETVATVSENGYVSYVSAGTATITATSENGLVDTCTVYSKECSTLTIEQPVNVNISNNIKEYVKFIPTEDVEYRIFAANRSNNNNNEYFNIYNSSMNHLTSSYSYIDYKFSAGNTYYIGCSFSSYISPGNGSFDLTAVKLVDAEEIVITSDSLTKFEGSSYWSFDASFLPENSRNELVTWSSSDDSVVSIEGGVAKPISAGKATITATSENGLSDSVEVVVKSAVAIEEGSEAVGTIDADNRNNVFKFIPSEDGIYRVGIDSDYYNRSCVIEYSGVTLASRYSYDHTFEINLVAGEIYYIDTEFWYDDNSGEYNIVVDRLYPATSIRIDVGAEYKGYEGTSKNMSVIFAPENAIVESITWTSSDSSVVSIDSNGKASLVGVGTATITATSENGLIATCVVTVEGYPIITVNAEKTVTLNSNTPNAYFTFVPEEDGYYSFYSISNSDTYGYILNSNMNTLVSDDDSGDGSNFKVKYKMTAGQMYFLQARYYNTSNSGSFSVCIEKIESVTSLEIISLPTRMDYIKGFVRNYLNYSGLKLKVTMSDNSTFEWSYGDGYINGSSVTFSTSKADTDGTVKISCDGAETSFKVNVLDKTVDHLEVIKAPSKTYIENCDGYYTSRYNSATGSYEQYFHYSVSTPTEAEIKIVYTDGTFVVAKINDSIDGYNVSWSQNQSNAPWTVGENKSTVTYLNSTVNLPITVVETPIESLEIVSGNPIILYENAGGYMSSRNDPELGSVQYFYYSNYSLSGVKIKINYKNGESAEADFDTGYGGYSFTSNNKQSEKPWVLGTDNCLYIKYMGVETEYPVTVVENPVESIVLNSAPTREYIFGDLEFGEIEKYYGYIYSFSPTDLTGLSFTVNYTDGTSKTFTDADVDENGMVDGKDLEYGGGYWLQGPEEVLGHLTYMGKTVDYTIKVNESPVASIEVVGEPENKDFIFGYKPDITGIQLKISYKDETSKFVTLSQDDIAYEYSAPYDNFLGRINVLGYLMEVDIEEYYSQSCGFYYLGALTTYQFTPVEKPEIESINLDNVTKTLDGMEITVSYADETKDSLTYDVVFCKTMAEMYPGAGSPDAAKAIGNTENGVLALDVYYLDENHLRINILGQQIEVEITESDAISGSLAGTNFEVVDTSSFGKVIVGAPNETAMTEEEFTALFGDSEVTLTTICGVVGTGSKITVDGEEFYIAVKGDIDGNGIANVFDALMVKKALLNDGFENETLKEFAADVDGIDGTDLQDVDAILSYIVGKGFTK